MKPRKKAKMGAPPRADKPVAGRFVLEVLADGTFRWHFNNVNPIALLGMLDCATHELREKLRAGEFKKREG